MSQTAIPYHFMRGGTSRGPYFLKDDLPADRASLTQVLIAAVGSGHGLNIDGLGGGNPVTTKVAILSASDHPWADVDYFFAQVSVEDQTVDYKPTCGNILTGVGPAAIEMGLVAPSEGETQVKIHAVNTGARVVSTVQVTGGEVAYSGTARIDGVPGTAAPVGLQFMDTIGGATGAFLPTGNTTDTFDGVAVTCMDVAMPMAIARADAFGLTGYESAAELNENTGFFARMEAVRQKAGAAMGMGDVSGSVTPKFGLLAPPTQGGAVAARYFMPWSTHPTMAVTGAQCLASCVLTPGTVAEGIAARPQGNPARVTLEHASGLIDVMVDYEQTAAGIQLNSAGLIRTARLIAKGTVMVPREVWTR